MKTIFHYFRPVVLLALWLTGTVFSLNAQCTPDPNIPQPGVFPDPLPGAVAGAQYNQVVDIVFRGDTVYLSQLTPFDSISIDDVVAPPGLTYVCGMNLNPCLFYPPSLGDNIRACISLDGTTIDSIGMNQSLEFRVTKWVTSVGLPVALRDTFRVGFADLVGVEEAQEDLFQGVVISPNPSQGIFTLKGEVPRKSSVLVQVLDAAGRMILRTPLRKLNARFEIPFDLQGRATGIYLVQLISEGEVRTWRVVVE